MTREEAIKTLSILKAAYPNSYRGMTKEEANGTINIWASQFINMPFAVVSIAINKLISTNTFPPTVSEVKEGIKALYWEAWATLNANRLTNELDENTVRQLEIIMELCSPSKFRSELTLTDLLACGNINELRENEGLKRISN